MEDKNGRLPEREANPLDYEYDLDSPFGGELAALQADIRAIKASIRQDGCDEDKMMELADLKEEIRRVWSRMCQTAERCL